METEILKVSKGSDPSKVAGAIAGIMSKNTKVEIEAIGAASVNQAVKSIAVARGYLAPIGVELVCKPAFSNVMIGEESKTSIKFICEKLS
jgi:stage V sporulation protein S